MYTPNTELHKENNTRLCRADDNELTRRNADVYILTIFKKEERVERP